MKTNAEQDAKTFDWECARTRLDLLRTSLLNAEHLSDEDSERVLRDRAIELGRIPQRVPDSSEVMEVVRFRLGEEKYAIGSEFVLELKVQDHVTPLPQTESHFVGVTNLRGEVTAVVDMARLLEIDAEKCDRIQVLVLGRKSPELAIIVSAIDHVEMLRRDSLIAPVGVVGGRRELMIGCTHDGVLVFGGEELFCFETLYIDQND